MTTSVQPRLPLMRRLLQVVLFLVDVCGVNRVVRRLTRHRIRVLMYHGVSDSPLGPDYWLMVARAKFDRQMSYLKGRFRVSSWETLLSESSVGDDTATPRVVITFDDGYANVGRNAYPTLRRYRFPAVCFVIPDLSMDGIEIWSTRLYRLLLEGAQAYVDIPGARGTRIHLPVDRERRRETVQLVINQLKHKPPSTIKTVLESVARSCGEHDSGSVAEEFSLMSVSDIQRLDDDGLVAIGSHTNAHYSLSGLDPEDQEACVADSIARLRAWGVEPARIFSYPSGHYDTRTIEILKRSRFQAAVTTQSGMFRSGDDLFRVKRLGIGSEITDLEFRALVSGLLNVWPGWMQWWV